MRAGMETRPYSFAKEGNVMAIAIDKRGNQLLGVVMENEDVVIGDDRYKPLTTSLVVVKGPRGFMLLKNKYRNEWELAGGVIEPGEHPKQCAMRECFEESGYTISDLRFAGVIKWRLVPDYFSKENRIEYGTLYCADVKSEIDFKVNEEMSDICWHTIGNPIENVSELDIKLLEYYL